jgi:G3E family GTPase
MLRVKGILNVAESPGRPLVVHGVQHLFHPPETLARWPSNDHRSRVVFITHNIEMSVVAEALREAEAKHLLPDRAAIAL